MSSMQKTNRIQMDKLEFCHWTVQSSNGFTLKVLMQSMLPDCTHCLQITFSGTGHGGHHYVDVWVFSEKIQIHASSTRLRMKKNNVIIAS